jgi:carbamoyltransferase
MLDGDWSSDVCSSDLDFLGGLKMTSRRFEKLFGGPPRPAEAPITQREMDIAASIQKITEEIVLRMARHARRETGMKYLCMAGGVALNCVANGRILKERIFEDIWIQPAAGDAGGALGAAYSGWHRFLGNERRFSANGDRQHGSYLGPAFTQSAVKAFLDQNGYRYTVLDRKDRAQRIAGEIEKGHIVGYLAGRMEFGPRALGARSILGDPRRKETQSVMNLKIKFRESFRPFAPSVMEDKISEYFDIDRPSPYMLLVADVRRERRLEMPSGANTDMLQRLNTPRSDIPAVTHLDYSARLQSVSKATKPDYYEVIEAFEKRTGCAVIVNTSFNVRGEPIVCTPQDAYRCFMRTDMDVLVLEDCMLYKGEQPEWVEGKAWRDELELD